MISPPLVFCNSPRGSPTRRGASEKPFAVLMSASRRRKKAGIASSSVQTKCMYDILSFNERRHSGDSGNEVAHPNCTPAIHASSGRMTKRMNIAVPTYYDIMSNTPFLRPSNLAFSPKVSLSEKPRNRRSTPQAVSTYPYGIIEENASRERPRQRYASSPRDSGFNLHYHGSEPADWTRGRSADGAVTRGKRCSTLLVSYPERGSSAARSTASVASVDVVSRRSISMSGFEGFGMSQSRRPPPLYNLYTVVPPYASWLAPTKSSAAKVQGSGTGTPVTFNAALRTGVASSRRCSSSENGTPSLPDKKFVRAGTPSRLRSIAPCLSNWLAADTSVHQKKVSIADSPFSLYDDHVRSSRGRSSVNASRGSYRASRASSASTYRVTPPWALWFSD